MQKRLRVLRTMIPTMIFDMKLIHVETTEIVKDCDS